MYKLFIGNETYLSFKNAKLTARKLLEQNTLEYISIDGEKTESSKIMDLFSSQSLFNTSRILFIKRLYKNKDKENLIPSILEHIAKNPNDTIIFWEDQKVSSITKYVKFFKLKNQLEEYNKLTKPSFNKYAKQLSSEYELNIDNELINTLCMYSNYNIERLENSIKKLKLLTGDKKISKEDIDSITQDTLEEDIWRLLDEMNSSTGKPLHILEKILNQGIDSKYILPMIARNLRLVTLTKYLLSQDTPFQEIASLIKVPPFTVRPLVEASNKYDWDKIKNKYEKLCNLDYEIKIGKIDSKLGLTLFCTTV